MRTLILALTLLALPACSLLAKPPPPPSKPCPGDCNGDGVVSIEEIDTIGAITLMQAPLSSCPAADTNHDGAITADEVVAAAQAAHAGCPK